jgi:hypothetical protein
MPTLAGQMQVSSGTSNAVLDGGVFLPAAQGPLLTALQAITDGGFAITVDGTARQVGPINFTTATSLQNCADLLGAAMAAYAIVLWNAAGVARFQIISQTAGAGSSITLASAPASGTAIHTTLQLTGPTGASVAQQLALQWVPCNGAFYSGYAPVMARPHTAPSKGTYRDYWRRNMGFARTRGVGGWAIGVPYDPSATYYVSLADDSAETSLVTPPTVQKPPAGVR